MRNLLLISNSTLHGSGYLDHCEDEIKEILKNKKRVTFVPYARPSGITHDEYTAKARDRFAKMGFELDSVHESNFAYQTIQNAEAIFIGGGNTFVLLNKLYETNILSKIKEKVKYGMPYIGTSAGSNVAGASIRTTNDMPIIYPPSFNALRLVPFIINPHYFDANPNSTHQGETRETRIKEYHIFNSDIVVGLREGAMLHVKDNKVILKGSTGARIFRKSQEPTEHMPGESLDFLL